MIRKELRVSGKVQGVGFRPFVYKIAKELNLGGFVRNDNIGVEIQIQGDENSLVEFKNKLLNSLPPLAFIDNIDEKIINICHKGQFEIIQSHSSKLLYSPLKSVSVSQDTSLCNNCKMDINNTEKYNLYFFTNCTNCGPRYSIIQTVPYDRINTSMEKFKLCYSCKKEYNNPLNRRYHAQVISCKNCGPDINLYINNKLQNTNNNIYETISNLLNDGKIGAIKGLGGFNIVCDARNTKVIEKLRLYKNRPKKAFAIMCKDIEQIQNFAKTTQKEVELLNSKEAPIVILNKKNNNYISNLVAPNINKIGCLLPYTGLHYILFKYINFPIISTSANISSEPIIINKDEISKKLPYIDFIVDFTRDIVNAIDDSVVQVVNNDISTLRLSRGYAPKEIILPFNIKQNILALGANSKNAIAFAFLNKIIISPYIGSLDSLSNMEYFNRTINTFKKFYDFGEDIIIHDKHPLYESTKWAKENKQNKTLFEVQHHLAHIYSVKAEYCLSDDYTSFVFDGTGYGDDKTLWGGEVFIGDSRKYTFKSLKLLGSSKAIKEPRRVALSMLFEKYTLDEVLNLDIQSVKAFNKNEIKLLHQTYLKDINCPSTSSVGRLFDGVASLKGICQYQTYEGEAGLLCENEYDFSCNEAFPFSISNNIIDINFDFFDKNIISKFINTLVNIIIKIAILEKKDVILSGGVFQNKILVELVCKKLEENNIKNYYNKTTPSNDGGICIGQIYYYISKLYTT